MRQAEVARLQRALETGPKRRVTRDLALGLRATRDDLRQWARYSGLIEALEGRE